MKILLYGINYSPEPVGIGKYSGEIAQWLTGNEHHVRVITAPPYFPAWKVTNGYRNQYNLNYVDRVRVQRCPLWIPKRPNGLKRIFHLASFALSSLPLLLAQLRWQPDVVITVAPAFFCAPGALLLAHLCGRKTVSWLHIQDFELDAAFELGLLKGKLLRTIAEIWERSILRRFDRVSSISCAMVKRLESKGVTPGRSFLLPNWVDLEQIRPQEGIRHFENSYRRELGISSNQVVLMYSGSMNKKQGLEVLAEVIHRLSDIPHLVWLLAGEGPTKLQLIEATQGLTQVHHLPLQPTARLNDWLNAADIHLLPQKAEAADLVLPSKLLGILASGKPVVASSPTESELASITKQAGMCVAPGDIDSFALALRKLISSPQSRADAGQRAREIAEEAFGVNTVLDCFEKELGSLVNQSKTKA